MGKPGATTVLLANLTGEARDVRVSMTGAEAGPAQLRVLDEHSFDAAADRVGALPGVRRRGPSSEGAVTVTLNPYAVARLDVTGD